MLFGGSFIVDVPLCSWLWLSAPHDADTASALCLELCFVPAVCEPRLRQRFVPIPPPRKRKTDHREMVCFSWQRNRDSNPNIQSQSLLCYRYTIPLCWLLSCFSGGFANRTYRVCCSGMPSLNCSASYREELSAPRDAIFLRNAESRVLPLHNSAKTPFFYRTDYIVSQKNMFVNTF